jgi:hypothetical protein
LKFGEMAEWLKAHAWKVCLGLNLTWVRIPLSPPYKQKSPRVVCWGFSVYGGLSRDESPSGSTLFSGTKRTAAGTRRVGHRDVPEDIPLSPPNAGSKRTSKDPQRT